MTGAALPLPGRAARPSRGRPARAAAPRALRALGDARLAVLAADGDERAFEAIYQRHHQALYRYCLSILRSPEDASDAVQGALMKALLALPAKKGAIALRPWLFRIAHNEAISMLRRRRPHEEIAETNGPLAPAADEAAADRERLTQLVDDLGELPERQRAALVMRELNAFGYDEIAVAFGTSAAAAKQAVYEARVALFERAEGREMACEEVRRLISEGDRRVGRARRVRAHVRSCRGCHRFEQLMSARRRDLAALAPPLPPAGAAAILEAVLGGAGGGGFAAAAGATAVKSATLALVAIAAGAGFSGMVSSHHAREAPDSLVARLGARPLTDMDALPAARPVPSFEKLTALAPPERRVGGAAGARRGDPAGGQRVHSRPPRVDGVRQAPAAPAPPPHPAAPAADVPRQDGRPVAVAPPALPDPALPHVSLPPGPAPIPVPVPFPVPSAVPQLSAPTPVALPGVPHVELPLK